MKAEEVDACEIAPLPVCLPGKDLNWRRDEARLPGTAEC